MTLRARYVTWRARYVTKGFLLLDNGQCPCRGSRRFYLLRKQVKYQTGFYKDLISYQYGQIIIHDDICKFHSFMSLLKL